ncbi:pyridoxamine 5'-phosphate oxidase [Nesterenkonia sp. MY13]|uniref:Pyridoxamine 5'-phosphate oxidase n=1 Tax=Nesterenkonia sedimenti TaxID=1463632 RepID=A0A7X8THI7_9MICC|nr:pyridoxamine 5'-phosphate oxidase [Nesterenkonia sedimenti]
MNTVTDETRRFLRSIPSLSGAAPELNPQDLPDDPAAAFLQWLQAGIGAGVPEPHVMTLSTVDSDGVPDARTLVLKDVDQRGWAFASTKSSRKGSQLAHRSAAALSCWWQPQMRAVRIRGEVIEATPEESLKDLHARSPVAQASVDPEDWTLWWVQPERVEFWQGSTDRRHQRIIYTRDQQDWTREVHRTEAS